MSTEKRGYFAITRERATSPALLCPRCGCQARALPSTTARFGPCSVGEGGHAYCIICDLCSHRDEHRAGQLDNANPNEPQGWDFVAIRDRLCLPCACGERQGYCIECETFQDLDPAAIAWGNDHERETTAWAAPDVEVDDDDDDVFALDPVILGSSEEELDRAWRRHVGGAP